MKIRFPVVKGREVIKERKEMSQENTNVTAHDGVNRAKLYQLVLFPLNNGATNVYYVLILAYIATFGNNVLA